MREVRYLTDDRDRDPEARKELVMQHGGNGDVTAKNQAQAVTA